ncbi:nuclear transport factor 2 family protein [Deinococcus sp. YIM 77859]|uniref:nuclear transport factor 2 family protein n=1 Tax=Deinococcus sp. YIM 77859 TaxID=1540221 RepID=UPI0005560E0D|nr:nuclear transport factor 2 family protein [Deinococcus sp. YIM 77859]
MANLTEQFMQALQTAEASRDPAPLVALFAEDATLQNLTTHTWRGQEGARTFWQAYLDNFQTIHSEFTHHTDDGRTGLMEWEATGQLQNGTDIAYRGASVIEHNGQQVSAFRTYYDSAAFVKPALQE